MKDLRRGAFSPLIFYEAQRLMGFLVAANARTVHCKSKVSERAVPWPPPQPPRILAEHRPDQQRQPSPEVTFQDRQDNQDTCSFRHEEHSSISVVHREDFSFFTMAT